MGRSFPNSLPTPILLALPYMQALDFQYCRIKSPTTKHCKVILAGPHNNYLYRMMLQHLLCEAPKTLPTMTVLAYEMLPKLWGFPRARCLL